MRGSRKSCQRGSKSDNVFFFFFFLVGEGRTEDPYNTKSGPSSARQRNADDSPTMNVGLVVL